MSGIVLGVAALAFCCWVVSLGGLASLQDKCDGCETYRWWWFIVWFDFTAVVAVLACAGSAALYVKARMSLFGLVAMVTVLYMIITNEAMIASDRADDGGVSSTMRDRIDTFLAGNIMVSTINCFLIIALGLAPGGDHHGHDEGKAANVV